MKAIVCTQYGAPDVLQIQERLQPKPNANEIRIRIRATSVSAADYRIRGLNIPAGLGFLMRLVMGFSRPRKNILGIEMAGVVDAIGANISQFTVGDKVFGLSGVGSGAYAEYICVKESSAVVKMLKDLSYEQAVAIPFGAHTALTFLRDKAKLKPGQRILINGASGAVGTAAVQLSTIMGALVTAVCSTKNIQLVKDLGAHKVFDYTCETLNADDGYYDVIFDTVGTLSFSQGKKLLKAKGLHLTAVAGLPQYIRMFWASLWPGKRYLSGIAVESKQDLEYMNRLVEQGQYVPVIDKTYDFEQIVDAHRYAETGHKVGSVVVRVNI